VAKIIIPDEFRGISIDGAMERVLKKKDEAESRINMMESLSQPEKFWEIRCHYVGEKGISGLCVGYEQGEWRKEAFVDYIMEWLPEFSLNSKERENLKYSNAISKLRKAAKLVYKTDKFKNRGEFGEIFLHAAIRSVFDSVPAISKIYYKSSHNETIKGFDCVHVVGSIDNLEMWVGEVKFYKSIKDAIGDVIKELKQHLEIDFLRDEFVLIENKLDSSDEYTKAIQTLISQRRSMDEIFKNICIPVLLTYESDAVKSHKKVCAEYVSSFEKEIKENYADFCKKSEEILKIRFHLFILPLEDKVKLITILDEKLKALQSI